MTDEKPSRPVPSDSARLHGVPDAPTGPAGLRLELSRSGIIDGHEAEFDEWMPAALSIQPELHQHRTLPPRAAH